MGHPIRIYEPGRESAAKDRSGARTAAKSGQSAAGCPSANECRPVLFLVSEGRSHAECACSYCGICISVLLPSLARMVSNLPNSP